jgi:hypothetical protein
MRTSEGEPRGAPIAFRRNHAPFGCEAWICPRFHAPFGCEAWICPRFHAPFGCEAWICPRFRPTESNGLTVTAEGQPVLVRLVRPRLESELDLQADDCAQHDETITSGPKSKRWSLDWQHEVERD